MSTLFRSVSFPTLSVPFLDDGTGARFLKAPGTLRAFKSILSSSVSQNGEVYTTETSCMNKEAQ